MKRIVPILAIALLAVMTTVVVAPVEAATYCGSTTIGSVRTPKGKYYYIQTITYKISGSSYKTEVWARENPNMCSYNDKLLVTIYTRDINKIKEAFCTVYKYYETGKLVGGCLATAGCCACAYSGCGGGIVCSACIAACNYALLRGTKDCVVGIVEKITGVPMIVETGLPDFGKMILNQICKK